MNRIEVHATKILEIKQNNLIICYTLTVVVTVTFRGSFGSGKKIRKPRMNKAKINLKVLS